MHFVKYPFLIKLHVIVRLFVNVLRPGDSEVTITIFESSCHLLLPAEVGTSAPPHRAPVQNRIFGAELMVRNRLKKICGMEVAEPSK